MIGVATSVQNVAELVCIVRWEHDLVRSERALNTSVQPVAVFEIVTDTDDCNAGLNIILLTSPGQLHQEFAIIRFLWRDILGIIRRCETVDFVKNDNYGVV